MSRPWYDTKTGELLLDDYVTQLPSYQRYTEDLVVTDEELLTQGRTVVTKLRKLEAKLPPEVRELATDALCELAVYVALDRLRQTPSYAKP